MSQPIYSECCDAPIMHFEYCSECCEKCEAQDNDNMTPQELYIKEASKAEYELDGDVLAAIMPSGWIYVTVPPDHLDWLARKDDEHWPWFPEDLEQYRDQPEIQELFKKYFIAHSLEAEHGI